MKFAIIILAAGSSSRMGQSKQLLKIKGVSMLERTIHIAQEAGDYPIGVVLGAEEEKHKKEIMHLGVDIVSNPHWENGMGSSIKAGLAHVIRKHPETEFVMILVCDQPLLTVEHLKKIIVKQTESGKPVIASQYSGVAGVPAMFNKTLFAEIALLKDDQGAKKIIQNHAAQTAQVDFQGGVIDLDTTEDYNRFQNQQGDKF